MKAMLLRALGPLTENPNPLVMSDVAEPVAAEGEVLIRVTRLRRLPYRIG